MTDYRAANAAYRANPQHMAKMRKLGRYLNPSPDLSPAEAATVARFDAAPYPADVLREQIKTSLHKEGAWCGICDYESGPCTDCHATLGDYADALLSGPLARFVQ